MLTLLAFSLAAYLPGPVPAPPCSYGRNQVIPESSSLSEQLRCYQSSGRKVSVAGTTFEDGRSSGGFCIRAVATDRFQVSGCASFGTDAALTIPFASVSYIGDDPRNEYVMIYLNR